MVGTAHAKPCGRMGLAGLSNCKEGSGAGTASREEGGRSLCWKDWRPQVTGWGWGAFRPLPGLSTLLNEKRALEAFEQRRNTI